jgi:hypothetical protein
MWAGTSGAGWLGGGTAATSVLAPEAGGGVNDLTTGALLLAVASPAVSSISTSEPADTLSPTLILSSLTMPPNGAGMSIAALSDSTVINESSVFRLSPTLTMISMTSTSLKLPISGTTTSLMLMSSSP